MLTQINHVAHRLKRKQVSDMTPTRDQHSQCNSPS